MEAKGRKSRKRLIWAIFTAALVALMAGIIFWPRHDDYDFLRALHPTESFGMDGRSPRRPLHTFFFTQSYDTVLRAVKASGGTWPYINLSATREPRSAPFELPNGTTAMLVKDIGGKTVGLKVYDEQPTWIQAQIDAIRGFFHL